MSNCDRCYRRKGKCDKLQPCGSCERVGVPCIYTDRTKERRYTADHVERLEKRIRQAEARNKSLADELSRVRSTHSGPQTSSSSVPAPQTVETHPRSKVSVDAVREVSYLSINAAGERQPYLGSTSGILLADLVRSSVDLPSPLSSHTTPNNTPPGAEQSVVSTVQCAAIIRKKDDLPPQPLAGRLVSAYLEHDNIAYPFLFPLFLADTLEHFYSEEGYYEHRASPFEVFIFNMVLAVATGHMSKFDWQSLPSAESHQQRAMAELNPVLAHGSIESLQALLLLIQWRTTSSVKDSSCSMWHTVGIAVRMCIELGLHRESTYPIKSIADTDADRMQAYRNQELGRRCFWCTVAMDRVTSNILGRPLGICDEDIETALPSVDSDALLTRPLASVVAGVQRIAVFNKLIEYRIFCGKLITTLHRKRPARMSIEDALKLRDELADELDVWYSDLGRLNLPSDSRDLSCFLSSTWYEVLYANATLMLWRPCPLLSDLSNDRNMLQRVYNSSTHAINTYAMLHRSRQINYSWVTLQSVFMAGLSYVYAVSRHMRDRRDSTVSDPCLLDRDPSTIDVVNITRACSNVLVAIAERWNTQRHCHEVFDRLSDAILADAIKLQTASSFAQQLSPMNGATSPATASVTQYDNSPPVPTLPSQQAFQQQYQTMPSPSQIAYWNNAAAATGQTALPAAYSAAMNPSPLAVDNEFMHCYDDIQQLHSQQQLEDPIMHLSQDWIGYLGGPNAASHHLAGTVQFPTNNVHM